MAGETIYDVLIKFGLDDKAAKQAVNSIKQIEAASAEKNKKEAQANQQVAAGMETVLNKVKSLAAGYLSVGAAVSFITGAVKQYISQAGMSQSTSREWLVATQEIEFATTKIGKSIAEKVLPLYKELANFISGPLANAIAKAASNLDLIIRGPGIIKDIAQKHMQDILKDPNLTQKEYEAEYTRTLNQAAKAGLTASSFGGKNPSDLIRMGLKPGSPEFLAAQYGYATESGRAYSQKYGDSLGIAGAGGANKKGGGVGPGKGEDQTGELLQELQLFWQQKKEVKENERVFNRQMSVMQRDYQRSELLATEDFQRTQRRSLRDHNLQLNFAESEFYRQRAISLRDFNISVARNDYDYQLSRKRAQEDQNFNLKQIMLSGDALAYYYSQRQFNISKQRAEEDYQLQKGRAQEDFTRQQNDSLIQFNISRAFQKKQWEISRADQREDFKIQRDRALFNFTQQKIDADYQYNEMKRLRDQKFAEQWLDQKEDLDKLLWYRGQITQAEVNNMKALNDIALTMGYNYGSALRTMAQQTYINSVPGGWGTLPSHASGGYTKAGKAELHDGEFVMTADTTKAAERIAKGNRLTQDSLLSALSGGRTYIDNRQFSRGLTADEKEQIRQETFAIIMEAYN